MDAGPYDPREVSLVRLLPWLRLFRAPGVSFDFRKVILGAVGLVLLNAGWSLLDGLFPASPDVAPPPSLGALLQADLRGLGPAGTFLWSARAVVAPIEALLRP